MKLSGDAPLRINVLRGQAEAAKGVRGRTARHDPNDRAAALQYRKTNMHLCPKGKWALGQDQWGKIVRVNMLRITAADWAGVTPPGIRVRTTAVRLG